MDPKPPITSKTIWANILLPVFYPLTLRAVQALLLALQVELPEETVLAMVDEILALLPFVGLNVYLRLVTWQPVKSALLPVRK